ncbi:MAG: hypothetical protein ACRCXC_03380 [Legionella sp.]
MERARKIGLKEGILYALSKHDHFHFGHVRPAIHIMLAIMPKQELISILAYQDKSGYRPVLREVLLDITFFVGLFARVPSKDRRGILEMTVTLDGVKRIPVVAYYCYSAKEMEQLKNCLTREEWFVLVNQWLNNNILDREGWIFILQTFPAEERLSIFNQYLLKSPFMERMTFMLDSKVEKLLLVFSKEERLLVLNKLAPYLPRDFLTPSRIFSVPTAFIMYLIMK